MTNNLHTLTDADQILLALDEAQPDPEPTAPSLDAQLATIQTEASRLPDASYNLALIGDFCDYLDDEFPALIPVTNDVYASAKSLAESHNKLAQTVAAAATLALEFRSQREDALTKLAQLRAEVETCDTMNPLIEALADQLEEAQIEAFETGFADYVSEQLWHSTPMEYEEITSLLRVLEELPTDSALWVEFREWLTRAEIEVEEPSL